MIPTLFFDRLANIRAICEGDALLPRLEKVLDF